MRLLPGFLLFFFAGTLSAFAQAAGGPFLEDMTWTELRAAIQTGKTTVLVPIGGVEQSGEHMALGKHNARARDLAAEIAAALGDAIVAPTVDYVPEGNISPPTEHMRYPGTITIPEAAFETVLEYSARSLRAAGFHDVFFLGDHGGYQSGEKAVAARLEKQWAGAAHVHAVEEYYAAAATDFPRLLKKRGFGEGEIGTHAGLADTSLTLALAPELVRPDKLGIGANRDGVAGDPARSSAELGKLGVDLIVSRTVAAIRADLHR